MSAVIERKEERLGLLAQFGLLAGPFLSMVDSNVVNVAIPRIAKDFGDPISGVQWTVSGYLLAMASGLAASAYLAKRWGTRRVYVASLVAFTLASLACATSNSTAMLTSARIAQGLAGAPLVPLAMGMLLGGEGARNRLSPAAGIVLFLAPAIGPSLGGILIAAFGWQSVFLVNLPLGLLGLAGVLKVDAGMIPGRAESARFDPIGLVLLSLGLALSIYGASQGPSVGWLSRQAFPFWSVGVVLLLAYAGWAWRHPHPVVGLRILRERDPGLAIGISVLAGVVLFAVLFLMPIFLQNLQGRSPVAAGLVLLPQGLVMAFGTVLGDQLTRRGKVRGSVVAGMLLLAATTASLIFIDASTSPWLIALLLSGRGLALGLIIQPLLVATLGELPASELADANTLFNVVERVAGSFGVALIATFLQARIALHPDPVAGFHDTVWLLVVLAGLGAPFALLLSRRMGARRPAV
ncbi:MAG TPA: DHA2 family efflux MFS transporter permease subunit [Candidatus Dormibacteraeota bacterium]